MDNTELDKSVALVRVGVFDSVDRPQDDNTSSDLLTGVYRSWNAELQTSRATDPQGYNQLLSAVETDPRVQSDLPELAVFYLRQNWDLIHDPRTGGNISRDELESFRKRVDDNATGSILTDFAIDHFDQMAALDDNANSTAAQQSDWKSSRSPYDVTPAVTPVEDGPGISKVDVSVPLQTDFYLQKQLEPAAQFLLKNFASISPDGKTLFAHDLHTYLLEHKDDADNGDAVRQALTMFDTLAKADTKDGDWSPWQILTLKFGPDNAAGVTAKDLQAVLDEFQNLRDLGVTGEMSQKAEVLSREATMRAANALTEWLRAQPTAPKDRAEMDAMTNKYNLERKEKKLPIYTVQELYQYLPEEYQHIAQQPGVLQPGIPANVPIDSPFYRIGN